MGRRTEQIAGQQTFLSLMLTAVVLFGVHSFSSPERVVYRLQIKPSGSGDENGVHFESDCNAFEYATSVGSRSVQSVHFCFPIAPQDI